MAEVVTREKMDSAAEELWALIKPEVGIDPKWTDDQLAEMIGQAAGLLESGDTLEASTLETLSEMGVEVPTGVTEKKKEVKKMAKAAAAPAVVEKPAKKATAKATPAKAEATPAKEKKATVARGEGNIAAMARLKAEGKSAKEIEKFFVKHYADKGQTDLEFVKKRIAIYDKLAK